MVGWGGVGWEEGEVMGFRMGCGVGGVRLGWVGTGWDGLGWDY